LNEIQERKDFLLSKFSVTIWRIASREKMIEGRFVKAAEA
jgi:hypothetical protein